LKLNGWQIVDDEPKKQVKAKDSKIVRFPSARERFADI
jgi:hypothetical protein